MDVIVIGGGVGGLGAALALSKGGHRITIVERDATPLPADPNGAFEWDRRGAPQVRHSHAFLARLRNQLRDRHPEVLAALFDAGATEMDFIEMLPEGMDRTRQPGDEDLVALACRRTTFEWVLRRAVLDDDHVRLRDGAAVVGLLGDAAGASVPARVQGVVLDDGTEIRGDLVVAANGRRSSIPAMVEPLGVRITETSEETGIIYFSRFFTLVDGADWPVQNGPIGGDLGYLKYGVFQGDNRTFSITLAVRTDDAAMRSRVLDPALFLETAAQLPATATYLDGRAEPITGVEVMAKLLNRRRRFTTDDGELLVDGFVAVGDAHTCTNPLYGRGCSLAVVQGQLLADALAEHPDDRREAITAYEAASAREVLPWYRAAVAQDAASRADAAASSSEPSGLDGDATPERPSDGGRSSGLDGEDMRALLRDGLMPAMRVDPVVIRAFLRMFNLLEPPDSLLTNWDVIGRVMQAYQDRENRPPEPELGPGRDAMLSALG